MCKIEVEDEPIATGAGQFFFDPSEMLGEVHRKCLVEKKARRRRPEAVAVVACLGELAGFVEAKDGGRRGDSQI